MISGDLIRLKNTVDDCLRAVRSIRREACRLSPEEIANLADYVRTSAPHFEKILDLPSVVSETASRS